jgi:predicted Co/Zn/Cd cation transporter (cation efflux family)
MTSLASGGREVEYGLAAWWAGILCLIGVAMTLLLGRRAKALKSPMLELDARSWMVSASLSLALLVGFVVATGLAGTRFQGWVPYLDAIALLAMALVMLPMPMMGLWRSMREVLQVAPDELNAQVRAVMDDVVKESQFLDYSSYIAKAGRGRFVEIHVLVPVDSRIDTATADAIRRDVSSRLDAGTPNFWLTIDFTADRRWM